MDKLELPPIVTPRQAAELGPNTRQEAIALVRWINERLTNVGRGERRIVIIPTGRGQIVYSTVKGHFGTAWNIRPVADIVGDPHDPREQSWHQWEFSEKA